MLYTHVPVAFVNVVWIPGVDGSKSTVYCPGPLEGAVGVPSVSVSFPRIPTVPFAPSSKSAEATTSSFAVGGQAPISTDAVVVYVGHPPDEAIVYVTM